MVKRRAIELVTQTVEDKLDNNGALRNVAVKDAWKRFRQKIEVKSWKEAEGVLQELTDSLQKINLLKSVSSFVNKLKTSFQNPEEMVEENDFFPKETPREDKSRTLELANDLQKSIDEIAKLEDCLRTAKQKIESSSNDPPSISLPTTYVSTDTKKCYESLSVICEKYKKTAKELEQSNTRIEKMEAKSRDMEATLKEKESHIDNLSAAVDTLEKKHNAMKENKMDTFKDQMKVKSIERQVETKDGELKKLTAEWTDLKQRFDALVKSKSGDTTEANNPFPPSKISEKYMELFKCERVLAVNYYKTSERMTDKDASQRVIDLLQDCHKFCETARADNMEVLSAQLCNPFFKEAAKTKCNLEDIEKNALVVLQRNTFKQSVDSVKNAFITHLEETHAEKFSLTEITGCLQFIEKCVDICWAVVLQPTPLMIDFDLASCGKTDVDNATFDTAEGKGKKVDYVIWPPLFSKKGGSVLKRGQIKAH